MIQVPSMIGETTLKAPRPSPGRGINPSGRMMRAMERDAERRIARALDKLRRDLMRGVTDANVSFVPLRLQSTDIVQPFADAIIAALTDVALAGADFGREQVERFVFGVTKAAKNFEINWELANAAAEAWARQYSYELVRGLLDTTRERLRGYIGEYAQNSETINQLGQRIAQLFDPTRARMIAVTEVTRSFAEGNTAAWRQSGVIERRRWNTANDELVCPICGPLNGVVVDIDASFPGGIQNPPAHPNCRCWVTPVVEAVEGVGAEQAATVPVGVPVSQAINAPARGRYAATYREALDTIDAVHGDGDLPEISIKTKSNMSAFGEYRYLGRLPKEIRIDGKGDHQFATVAHEVGHFLDHQTLSTKGRWASIERGGIMSEWAEAVSNSNAVKELVNRFNNPDDYVIELKYTMPSGTTHTYTSGPNKRHLEYLLDNRELWARSYSQYIAEKSGNETMIAQIHKEREDKLHGHRQWDSEDFKPIMRAIDNLFRVKGWIK